MISNKIRASVLPQSGAGFTLIELMIAVAVIGILAAIAYPNYVNYVKQGDRSSAKSVLLQDATILERNYSLANRYDNTFLNGTGSATSGLIMANAPMSGTALYNVAVAFAATTPAGQTFTLTATPVTGGFMANDICGSFTLTNTGLQGVTGTASVATCWGK